MQDPTEIAYSEQTCWMLAVRDQRDKAAFKNLFGFFAPRLKGMLMRNGTPGAQAEEIVQEVLLTVWQKSAQFDPQRAEASGWIYRIARNRMIDVARKERRPVPEELMIEEPPAEDPAQIMALEQEMSRLRKALAELPPKQRAMVERAYMGELTHQEIEASTGLPLGTIKSRIRLGLDRLRHELRELRDK